MRTLNAIVTGIVFTAILQIGIASAAPTSELLQKGLYAEEVEGNMDSAIKIYGEVIKKADAPRNHIAQALYRQGMCYLKVKDEQAARASLEKLVNEYADQTEMVQKAQLALDDLMDFDPAALMPPGTLIYVELGSPGKQVETILTMLKGTVWENPLAAIGSHNSANPNQKSAGDIVGALLNPSMMAEFKKIRGSAIGVTGVAENNPPMIMVLYPGKSDALRGLIMAGLNMAGAPAEPIEGMQTINIQNTALVAYDDKVILIAQPADQLKWVVRQYKGLANEPTLASSNASFAKISKKARHDNLLTAWVNVDETYSKVLKIFPAGQIPKQIFLVDALVDFNHIDYLTMTNSIETDGFADTTEIVFKDGHHCLAYDLIRTPNINKAALSAVPSDAVAIATFALSADNENQAGAVRGQIKNITGLDIGREIFANIEQVIIFAMPAKTPSFFFPASIGLAITSHNPQQTRQILAKTIGTADSIFTGRPVDANSFGGKYQIGQIQNNPMYCYIEQAGNVTIISLNPEITQASVKAIKDKTSVCNAGPLSDAVAKMPASASKMILVNAGGTIRLATPVIIDTIGKGNREALQTNFEQLAIACDKTTIELRTDEQLNSFTLNRKLTGMPPLNQVFGPCTQIGQLIGQAKASTKAETAKKQAGITIKQATAAPVIDGIADGAWSAAEKINLTNVINTPISSPNDLAANFKTMWDKDNLYMFVDVTDDVLKNDSSDAWQNDAVEVFIDADNSKADSYGPTDYQYVFAWDKTSPKILEVKHQRTEGVQFAMVTTDTGYRVEIKFPWSTLGTKPRTGAKIGLDVHISDNDSGGKKRDRKLTWYDAKDKAYDKPQVFGNAELGGLVGWWKLDEKDSTTAADSSGNGNDGTLVGNPQWRPEGGKIGGAIELSGKGDYIKIDNEAAFNITNEITISAWVNITSVPQEWTAIVTKGDTAWRMSTDYANNIPHFGVAGGTMDCFISGKTTINSGKWHNVICRYDGKAMNIYVDGKLDFSKPRTGPIATNNLPVCIGENIENSNRCFNGLIDDVRVYNYALSENEIAALAAGK